MLCARGGSAEMTCQVPRSYYYSGDDTDGSLLEILQPAPEPDHKKEVSRARGAAEVGSPKGLRNGHGERIWSTEYCVHGTELWRREDADETSSRSACPSPERGVAIT
ncbi:hypothetical protein VTN00DRAFT_356 [Thermoascus crustaceus]|uniref:uncharacterized protein n=1 Tax=Thermoascus crustaceus TaxID=5088 RepID=UPI003743B2A5